MKRSFHDVLVHGLEEVRSALEQGPLILAPNHVSWWDPLALVLVDQALDADGYGLMATESLAELTFFRRLGALPLDRSHPRASVKDLERAARYLDRARRFVAIFPSGRQAPSHFPLQFRAGALWLHTKSAVDVVPLAFRYEFLESPKPTLLLSFGPPLILGAPRAQALSALEEGVERQLAHIDAQLLAFVETKSSPPRLGFRSLLYPEARAVRHGRVPRLSRFLSWMTALPRTRAARLPEPPR